MKVLVTGAGGMLGHTMVEILEQDGHEVLPLSRQDADVTLPEALAHPLKLFRPDWIFNLAAFTRVDDCEAEPDRAHAVNGIGARNTALAAAGCGAAILSVSTDYVFDGVAEAPYREHDLPGPRSVYGKSKWAGEQAVRAVHPRHLIVRTAWLFGRGGANFVDTVVRRASQGEPLRVVDDQRGAPTWTRDLAPALIRLAATHLYGTYHVTSAGSCTWWELAKHVAGRTHASARVDKITTAELGRPAPRPAYSVLSNQWYEQATGHRMPHWQDAVDRYLDSRHAAEPAASAAARKTT